MGNNTSINIFKKQKTKKNNIYIIIYNKCINISVNHLSEWTIEVFKTITLFPPSCDSSVQDERPAGDDHGGDQGLADHRLLHLPAGVGPALPREVRAGLPAQQVRVVRQVQVALRVAAGRPGGGRQGESTVQLVLLLMSMGVDVGA